MRRDPPHHGLATPYTLAESLAYAALTLIIILAMVLRWAM